MSSEEETIFSKWLDVENQISEEVQWLKSSISTFLKEEKHVSITCNDCLLRQIAILIVSGQIKAKEIIKDSELLNFWFVDEDREIHNSIEHGEAWHSQTMLNIQQHFITQGYTVVVEPSLHWGRADLGIFKDGVPDLYIEVGTTTLFKLFTNLKKMRNCIILLVPNDNKLIEFTANIPWD